MSTNKIRMAEFRKNKKQEGFSESTVWLSPEERRVIEVESIKLGVNKSDVIRIALRRAFTGETEMIA